MEPESGVTSDIREPSLIGIGQSVSPPSAAVRIRQPGRMIVPLLGVLTALLIAVSGAVSYLLVQTRDTLQTKERELLLVNAERDDLKGQLAQTLEAKAKLDNDLSRVRKELTSAQEQLTTLSQERETLSRTTEDQQRRIEELSREMERLSTERQGFATQLEQLTTERSTMQRQLTELEAAKGQLEAKLLETSDRPTVELDKVVVSGSGAAVATADLPTVLPTGGGTSSSAGTTNPGPVALSGQVVVINRDYDFIVMNLGRNHGLAIGQEFKIVRGSDELGRVKVEKVYDELSAAALLPDSKKESIKEGDTIVAL